MEGAAAELLDRVWRPTRNLCEEEACRGGLGTCLGIEREKMREDMAEDIVVVAIDVVVVVVCDDEEDAVMVVVVERERKGE